MNRLTYARFRGITQHSFGPVVSIDALVAVDALGEVLARLTDAAPLVVEVDVAHLDTLQGLSVILASEGRDSGQQEIRDDTTSPKIRGKRGPFSIDNFGCHIFWLAVFHFDDSDDTSGEGEIADFDFRATRP